MYWIFRVHLTVKDDRDATSECHIRTSDYIHSVSINWNAEQSKMLTSAILSSRCPTVSRRLAFVCSIASNLTSTASIFDTMLPMECSMRSTLRCSIENSSCVTPRPPRLFPPHPLRPVPPRISDFVVVESSSSSLRSKLSESSFSANCKKNT